MSGSASSCGSTCETFFREFGNREFMRCFILSAIPKESRGCWPRSARTQLTTVSFCRTTRPVADTNSGRSFASRICPKGADVAGFGELLCLSPRLPIDGTGTQCRCELHALCRRFDLFRRLQFRAESAPLSSLRLRNRARRGIRDSASQDARHAVGRPAIDRGAGRQPPDQRATRRIRSAEGDVAQLLSLRTGIAKPRRPPAFSRTSAGKDRLCGDDAARAGAKLQQVFDKIAWEPPDHSAATR